MDQVSNLLDILNPLRFMMRSKQFSLIIDNVLFKTSFINIYLKREGDIKENFSFWEIHIRRIRSSYHESEYQPGILI